MDVASGGGAVPVVISRRSVRSRARPRELSRGLSAAARMATRARGGLQDREPPPKLGNSIGAGKPSLFLSAWGAAMPNFGANAFAALPLRDRNSPFGTARRYGVRRCMDDGAGRGPGKYALQSIPSFALA